MNTIFEHTNSKMSEKYFWMLEFGLKTIILIRGKCFEYLFQWVAWALIEGSYLLLRIFTKKYDCLFESMLMDVLFSGYTSKFSVIGPLPTGVTEVYLIGPPINPFDDDYDP